MVRLIIFSCIVAVSTAMSTRQSIQSLLCREWKVNYFEENGRKELPDADEENDRMFFHSNSTAEFIESGEQQDGTWEYDVSTKRLVFTERTTKERITMKVISLTRNELVLELKDSDGSSSVAHLVPVR